MVDLPEGLRNERVAAGVDEQSRADDMMEQVFVMNERGMRTDTEGTLVGQDDDKSRVKEFED